MYVIIAILVAAGILSWSSAGGYKGGLATKGTVRNARCTCNKLLSWRDDTLTELQFIGIILSQTDCTTCPLPEDNPCGGDKLGNYWFGPSCRFQCHCYDRRQCDSTTRSCSSLECETGYFGPGCQYFSIAHKQPTAHSSTSSRSSSAVDGFTSTYSLTRSTLDPTWSVELHHPAWIVWVDVNVPANNGTREITMTTRNKDTVVPCNATNTWITSTTLRITCRNVVNATNITLIGTESTESRLALSEVQVYGGRNIALRGDTSQSSVFDMYNSSLAVDAGTSARFEDKSCTHTAVTSCSNSGTTDPNWILRLGQDYQIYRVDVYNRNAPNDVRLKDFRIRLGKAGVSGLKRVYHDRSDTSPEVTSVQMPASRTANRLEVTLRGDCKILTLCEVQVFGDCLDYKYGLECNFTCRCHDRAEVCNKVDGSCVSGCGNGFTGVDCKQECPEGRYGFNCTNTCSSNCVDAHCNHVDGTCTCVPGWMGDRCTTVCDQGTYGHECSNKCSTCRDSICHPGNGTCIMGCQHGWAGSRCDTACDQGTYGHECSNKCSTCRDSICHPGNGTCIMGCQHGWAGSRCDAACDQGTYGHECSNKCSTCRDSICHPGNGTCIMGCQHGWAGSRCDTVCDQGTYGHECSNKCSTCRDSICHPGNGTCIIGCQHGWAGSRCDTECPPGSYGQDCGMHCSNNCVGSLCDHVNGMCTCILGWKGDKCDRLDADPSRSSVNPILSGLAASGFTVVVAVVVAAVVLLARRHRRRRQRIQEQVIYHDIIDDIPPGVPGSQVNQSESREDYDVLDVTSRDPDDELGKPYTALNAIPQQRESKSLEDNDVLDVTSRDPEEGLERTYTELTTNTLYQNIPISGRDQSC